ncbi:MAG: type II toxin-antitoxin system RelB/DinJ family antitoxin [Coriobacteriales bacterium]|jgi:DNA-damage-inducible protein J|nr:type II toxin-antitoxin system RelB/DinJ family antitoxin [Coriobacteriales bacterium]
MGQTAVNFRMDDELKERFVEVCHDMGLNASTAFTIFAKTVVRENGIPFPVSADSFFSDNNLLAIRRAKERLDAGDGVTKRFSELEALAK